MEPHPLAERFPLIDGDEYERFRADIAANGLRDAITTFGGKILDGRNRYRACLELGVTPRFVEFVGTEEEAAALVDSRNLERRHLTAEQQRQRRAEKVRQLAGEGMSQRAIAEAVGVDVATVNRDLKRQVLQPATPDTEPESEPCPSPSSAPSSPESRPDPEPPPPPRVTGRDGKQYPAARPHQQQPRPAGKPAVKTEAEPGPATPTPWSDVVGHLTRLAESIQTTASIPEEMKPWQLVESLEQTGRALLQRARELRRRHRLT